MLGPGFAAKGITFGLMKGENLVQSSDRNERFLNQPSKSPELNSIKNL